MPRRLHHTLVQSELHIFQECIPSGARKVST